MNTAIIILFLGLAATLIYLYKDRKNFSVLGTIIIFIASGIISFLVGIIFIIVLTSILSPFFSKTQKLIYETKLVSLKSNSNLSGSFFLGSGSIGLSEYYFYYMETEDGGFVPGKISANNNVVIYEEDRTDGSFEKYCNVTSLNNWIAGGVVCDESVKYKIRIPKGSFVKGFRVE